LVLWPAALLLGSAKPPVPLPQLQVDDSVFADEPGCPPGVPACILLAGSSGEILLAGLPRPVTAAREPQPGEQPVAPVVRPPASPVKVVVSLAEQKAYVFHRGALVATAPVSTGRPGHPTPIGTFRILQKKVHHMSNRYSNAPMPFMQRLTNYGIALHAGKLPGYPASHGCIRLPWSFARKLYAMTDRNTRVTITREKLRVRSRDLA
jgi:lipoprotein-anchoring transpeptidase ErfK/SrfK